MECCFWVKNVAGGLCILGRPGAWHSIAVHSAERAWHEKRGASMQREVRCCYQKDCVGWSAVADVQLLQAP